MAMRTTLDSHYTYAVEIACCVGDLCHSNASNNVRKKGGGGVGPMELTSVLRLDGVPRLS